MIGIYSQQPYVPVPGKDMIAGLPVQTVVFEGDHLAGGKDNFHLGTIRTLNDNRHLAEGERQGLRRKIDGHFRPVDSDIGERIRLLGKLYRSEQERIELDTSRRNPQS